jgi:sulfite reductase (NADPH) flavoprotein alpha-component
MYLHPGGERLLMAAAGIDSTRSYEKVEHHLNSEVHSQLDLYKIGTIRRLNFKQRWAIAIQPPGLVKRLTSNQRGTNSVIFLTLDEFYRHWIRFTYQIVEVENSLHNNFSLRQLQVARPEQPETMSKLKAQLLLSSHNTFYESSLPELVSQKLELLWNMTLGFCAADVSITLLPKLIAYVRSSAVATKAEAVSAQLAALLQALPSTPDDGPKEWSSFDYQLQHLERCDQTLIGNLKSALREGLLAFEQHEDRVVEEGRTQLMEALKKIPKILEHYYTDLTNCRLAN